MGIIRAAIQAVGGGLADSYLEVVESAPMSDTTVMAMGVPVNQKDRRNTNKKGTSGVISNGSVIRVQPNQFMMLIDGGKIVDYTAEEGYYKVDNSSMPSLFNGQLGESVKETFNRVRFGGVTPLAQQAVFINLQEIKGIRFGTPNPVTYFDNFYNAELRLRAYGDYSIKIVDPIKFYKEAIPRTAESVDIQEINEQYRSEFLGAFGAALNQLSVDNIRISHVASHNTALAKHMATVLDEEWNQLRGMVIQSVGIADISYDDSSKDLIDLRNKGAMLGDPSVREGYVQGSVARGIEAAGSNSAGSMAAFAGLGIGMNAGGSVVGAASAANQAQQQANAQAKPETGWTCDCGQAGNQGRFCSNCGKPKPEPAEGWTCSCGTENKGNFCSNCGKPKPKAQHCKTCGWTSQGGAPAKFCPDCGTALDGSDQ